MPLDVLFLLFFRPTSLKSIEWPFFNEEALIAARRETRQSLLDKTRGYETLSGRWNCALERKAKLVTSYLKNMQLKAKLPPPHYSANEIVYLHFDFFQTLQNICKWTKGLHLRRLLMIHPIIPQNQSVCPIFIVFAQFKIPGISLVFFFCFIDFVSLLIMNAFPKHPTSLSF